MKPPTVASLLQPSLGVPPPPSPSRLTSSLPPPRQTPGHLASGGGRAADARDGAGAEEAVPAGAARGGEDGQQRRAEVTGHWRAGGHHAEGKDGDGGVWRGEEGVD